MIPILYFDMCKYNFHVSCVTGTCLKVSVNDAAVSLHMYCVFFHHFTGGGSGFVGRELMRLLRHKGHEVTVISRQPGPGKITWVRWKQEVDFSFLLLWSLSDYPLLFVTLLSLINALTFSNWTALCRMSWSVTAFRHVRGSSTWQERIWWTRWDGQWEMNTPLGSRPYNPVD